MHLLDSALAFGFEDSLECPKTATLEKPLDRTPHLAVGCEALFRDGHKRQPARRVTLVASESDEDSGKVREHAARRGIGELPRWIQSVPSDVEGD